MTNITALEVATISIREIRMLLYQKSFEQALDFSELLQGLPTVETKPKQLQVTLKNIIVYLKNHKERKTLAHWVAFIEKINSKIDTPVKAGMKSKSPA